ncbi:MAG TPA: ATP-dependent Clp protease adaptor ClpS [Bacteroidetes bacterium]|nr:ATP-dependent Clp protease adaptor ClpS [Bacteroidota bacterium]
MPLNPLLPDEDIDVLIEEEISDDAGTGELSQLIVYNDDVNTFDWVIECFVKILKHTSEQAEQLAIIIHTKGRATVKTAPFKELRAPKEALVERGLSAVIEDGA